MTLRTRPTPESAFFDYLNLGPDRSLQKLRLAYEGTVAGPPDLRTLKGWSGRYGWQDRVKEHEMQVCGMLQAASIQGTAELHIAVASDLHATARRIVAHIAAALPTQKIIDPKEADALETLADVAVKLSAHALQIERGRVPDAGTLKDAMAAANTIVPHSTPAEPPKRTKTILEEFRELTGDNGDDGKLN